MFSRRLRLLLLLPVLAALAVVVACIAWYRSCEDYAGGGIAPITACGEVRRWVLGEESATLPSYDPGVVY